MKQVILLFLVSFILYCSKESMDSGNNNNDIQINNGNELFIGDQAIVNTTILNVREKSNSKAKINGILKFSSKITIFDKSAQKESINSYESYWFKIKDEKNKITGWVFGQYLVSSDKKYLGTYFYEEKNPNESHYIKIYVNNREYTGLYIGSEDTGGHGVFFYKNKMKDLKIDNDEILFIVGARDYFDKPFQVDSEKMEGKIIGGSNGELKYSGNIEENKIVLKCEGYDCWSYDEMIFKRL
jgi:hypothetical protein